MFTHFKRLVFTPLKKMIIHFWKIIFITIGGCSSAVIMHPKGEIGANEISLIYIAGGLMLFVVLPAIFMTILFTWRYRGSNKKAKYTPEWRSSKIIETSIWIIPSIIIIILSVLVWNKSHSLDPYRPIESNVKPLTIQVISLDWKWLFIYPEQNIASVNLLFIPVHVPIHFVLTSDTVMNSFFIPQLGSQIMTMAGMQTQLYLVADSTGDFDGISSNFSGLGFTNMKFKVIAKSQANFDFSRFKELAKSSINHPVTYFSSVTENLYNTILNSHGDSPINIKEQ
jgi:cytochrome o ubiquinol oxidase subunit 2